MKDKVIKAKATKEQLLAKVVKKDVAPAMGIGSFLKLTSDINVTDEMLKYLEEEFQGFEAYTDGGKGVLLLKK